VLEGVSVIALGGPLPPREAAELVEKLARAMSVAHKKHIIHRDLKPANVLLVACDHSNQTRFGPPHRRGRRLALVRG